MTMMGNLFMTAGYFVGMVVLVELVVT